MTTNTQEPRILQIRADRDRFNVYDDGKTFVCSFDTYEAACAWRYAIQHPTSSIETGQPE
jgi:hypothetical protein